MSEDIDEMKRELEEIREMKEALKKEIEAVRKKKERPVRDRERRLHEREKRRISRARPIPPVPPVPPVVDLTSLTEGLEEMMDGLGEQIEMSLGEIGDIRLPHLRVRTRKGRKSRRKRDIEKIPPERIASVVAPLGSEERLRIIQFLGEGGKSFQDIEAHTGKTGSSLTHHLSPLIEAGYIIKGEVRGTYYVSVLGRLSYRLLQWLTSRVELERHRNGDNGDKSKERTTEDEQDEPVEIDFEEEDDDVEDEPE